MGLKNILKKILKNSEPSIPFTIYPMVEDGEIYFHLEMANCSRWIEGVDGMDEEMGVTLDIFRPGECDIVEFFKCAMEDANNRVPKVWLGLDREGRSIGIEEYSNKVYGCEVVDEDEDELLFRFFVSRVTILNILNDILKAFP
jgi:hypothetical protein